MCRENQTKEEIKATLRLFTSDFSASDVRFLEQLSYPCRLFIIKPERAPEDFERKKAYTLEDLDDFKGIIKRIEAFEPLEKIVIEVVSEKQGRMILVRED